MSRCFEKIATRRIYIQDAWAGGNDAPPAGACFAWCCVVQTGNQTGIRDLSVLVARWENEKLRSWEKFHAWILCSDTEELSKGVGIVSEKIIVVEIYRPDVPCLDIVDLPGLTTSPPEKAWCVARDIFGCFLLSWTSTPNCKTSQFINRSRPRTSIGSISNSWKTTASTAITTCTYVWWLLLGIWCQQTTMLGSSLKSRAYRTLMPTCVEFESLVWPFWKSSCSYFDFAFW